jgi:hypothetical protein
MENRKWNMEKSRVVDANETMKSRRCSKGNGANQIASSPGFADAPRNDTGVVCHCER